MAETTKKFESAGQQVVYYVKRFALYCHSIMAEAKFPTLPSKEDVVKVIEAVPAEIYMTYVLEVDARYGEDLKKQDLETVTKLLVLYMPNSTGARHLMDKTAAFISILEENETKKKRFFLYWTVIKEILDRSKSQND
jgi:hypothetical protein